MDADSIVALIFIAFLYPFYLKAVLKPYWRILQNEARRGGGRLQFTIADCWAASIGLSLTAFVASLMMATDEFRDHTFFELPKVIVIAVFMAVNQLAGITIVLATNVSPVRQCRNDGASAFSIILGAWIGILLPLIGWFMILSERQSTKHDERIRARVQRNNKLRTVARARARS